MKQKLMCLLLFLFLVGVYIWTNEKLSFFMLLGMVLCVICAVLSNYIASKMLKAECRIEGSKQQTNGVLQLNIHNRSVFPIFQVKVEVSLLNMLTESQVDIKRCFIVMPFEKKQEQIHFDSLYCGKIEMNACEVWTQDCFGLTQYRCQVKRKGHYYCYPASREMSSEIDKHSTVRNHTMEKYLNRKGNDPAEILDIREYQRGDNVKMIHWKLSHKLGMKVVKELDMPSNQDTLLIFALQGNVTDAAIHRLVEYSMSFSRNLLKMDIHHDVVLLDSKGVLIRNYTVESEDTFSWLEKRVLEGQISLEKTDMDSFLTQKDYTNRYASVFYILEEPITDNVFGDSVEYVIAQ